MKELIYETATQKGFEVCLKVCITELRKQKLTESQLESIFRFFDIVSLPLPRRMGTI